MKDTNKLIKVENTITSENSRSMFPIIPVTSASGKNRVIASNNEEMLPNVHRIAALLKKWLLGTHQNYTSQDRLQKYLDEFSFRYNRRKSKSRGLLFHRIIEQAMIREPILSTDVIGNKTK